MTTVYVPTNWVDKCARYAKEAMRSQPDVSRQYQIEPRACDFFFSKMAEVALAIHLGDDPAFATQWIIGAADPGYDVMDKDGLKYDVKSTTNEKASRLIWPMSQNATYSKKDFDFLVFCIVDQNPFGRMGHQVEIVGYETKRGFFERKQVSDGSDRLKPGTWYMRDVDLLDISGL